MRAVKRSPRFDRVGEEPEAELLAQPVRRQRKQTTSLVDNFGVNSSALLVEH